MRVNIKDLGKVSVTAEGLHSLSKPYERVSIVHDGLYSSYISRKDVPIGIQLNNEEYWQPIASLKEEFRADLIVIRKDILDAIADVIKKLKNSRIVVANEADRNALTINEVAPGCEVYELDTERTYILDTIIANTNAKTWHIESDGLIDSEPKYELSGTYDELVADRARCDQFGNVIDQTYLTTAAVNEFIKKNVEKHLTNIGAVILPESIKPSDLSPAVLELIGYRNITNFPDEEDLTAANKCNGTQVLKFKDKQYVPDSFSGDGIVHLRQHFYANVNVLDQCAINKPNTIYIIKYDFCLYDKTIILPENVTLDFQGGHISNGTLILNKTKVKGVVGSVYDYLNCNLFGTFLDGQLSYEDDKMCCWQTNNFIPICNCGTEPTPPPVYKQRTIGIYGYDCQIGFKKNAEAETTGSMSMSSSYSPNDVFTGRVIIPNDYEFKGWYKAVYSGRVPVVSEILNNAVFYSDNEIISVDYNSLVDSQTTCFVAKCEKIIYATKETDIFITGIDINLNEEEAKIGMVRNDQQEKLSVGFRLTDISKEDNIVVRPIIQSGLIFDGWHKVIKNKGERITEEDKKNAIFISNDVYLTLTYDDFAADKMTYIMAIVHRV